MINSFADDLTEEIFHGIHSHAVRINLSSDLVKKAQRKLDLLNGTDNINSLSLIPENRAEALVRDAHEKYSIPIDNEWRITFRWGKERADDVKLKR